MELVLYKKGGILDLPRATLDPDLWEFDGQPTLREDVKDIIVDSFMDWVEEQGYSTDWVQDMYFIGSSAGYQYREISDIDITIVPNLEAFHAEISDDKEEIREFVRKMIKELNGFLIGKHDCNYYIRMEATIPIGEAIYNIFTDTWIKTAQPLPPEYHPETKFKDQWLVAEARAATIDTVIGKLRRRLSDHEILQEYSEDPDYEERIKPRLEKKEQAIDQWVQWLSREYKDLWRARNRAYEVEGTQTSSANILYKFLERYGYNHLMIGLRKIREEWTVEDIKELLDEFESIV